MQIIIIKKRHNKMQIYKLLFLFFVVYQIYYLINDFINLTNLTNTTNITNCLTINNNVFLHNLLTIIIEYLSVVFLLLNIKNDKPYFVLCSIYMLLMTYGLYLLLHMNDYCIKYFALNSSSTIIFFTIKLFFSFATLTQVCKICIDKLLNANITIKIE